MLIHCTSKFWNQVIALWFPRKSSEERYIHQKRNRWFEGTLAALWDGSIIVISSPAFRDGGLYKIGDNKKNCCWISHYVIKWICIIGKYHSLNLEPPIIIKSPYTISFSKPRTHHNIKGPYTVYKQIAYWGWGINSGRDDACQGLCTFVV